MALGVFMAAGKSTVGPLVAARLDLPFVDLDEAVASSAHRSLAALFLEEGEEGFRAREATAVKQICLGPPAVVALGGGTLHHGDNLARLRARFEIVVLHVEWPVIAGRLNADEERPLAGRGRSLYQARLAGYRAAGSWIDATHLSPEEAAEAVIAALESR